MHPFTVVTVGFVYLLGTSLALAQNQKPSVQRVTARRPSNSSRLHPQKPDPERRRFWAT